MESRLHTLLQETSFARDLVDRVPDIVFFIKDTKARYLAVNRTLVSRCGAHDEQALLGRTTRELFPPPLGERFHRQDMRVLTTGRALVDRLELHLYPDRCEGWCLTTKTPIIHGEGQILGLAGMSRDLHLPESESDLGQLADTVAHIQASLGEALRVEQLAARAGLSVYRFQRRIREIFQLSPAQLITRLRIETASELLRDTGLPIAEVAQRCGYCDQSAFSRQFKAACGLTPRQYRERHVRPGITP